MYQYFDIKPLPHFVPVLLFQRRLRRYSIGSNSVLWQKIVDICKSI